MGSLWSQQPQPGEDRCELVAPASPVSALRDDGRIGGRVFCMLQRQVRYVFLSLARLFTNLANCMDQTRSLAPSSGKRRKIFIDGVFDLTHFGHMNAFRQARLCGDYLIVGVNSDESVFACKGARPVLTDEERCAAVKACRFVDEIVPTSPYIMSEDYIEKLIRDYGVDFFVHGDDPCIVDGKDVYEAARKANKFVTIPRTEGISTTDIVGRLLLSTKEHHEDRVTPTAHPDLASRQSQYLVTSSLMKAFTANLPGDAAGNDCRIVYVDGAWDMFHAGHISLLQQARTLGDRLVVGVHSDDVVNQHRGMNFPIMAMHERVLSVLGCRHVDDVLLNAPWAVTEELVATLRVSTVVRGKIRDTDSDVFLRDPHAVPQRLGIHVELESLSPLTLSDIAARLQQRRADVERRHAEKARKESEWYRKKHGLS